MEGAEKARELERYIGLDIHKEYALVGGQNGRQEWVLPARRVGMEKFREWAGANLREGDAVVIETTTNVWDIYDVVAPLATRTVVAHARGVRQIAEARVKTDRKDIERLIRLLIADIVPEVWVPPVEVRELRGMISYRNRLVKTSTMVRNRLQSLAHRHNLLLPKGALTDTGWWAGQKLSALEQIQIRQELALLEELGKHKAEVDAELGRQSLGAVWGKQAVRLLQLSGFGVVITMTVLSAIGDIARFESAKKLVGYAGLGAGVHDSGKEHIEKRITKSGRKELRWALVEAAWRAIRISPYWKEQYEKYLKRMRKPQQAIVVIARKLLVTVWHVLTKEEMDEHVGEEDLAYKMLVLSWDMDESARLGLTYKQFAKYALLKLGVETDITRFVRKDVPRRVASNAETLARMAELGLSL
ncbi:MAG: IS110 family transposase [Anaerolineales bacterium]|nr:MAG: IS110 family transposase [Anaerolineales bacterium]